MQLRRGPSVGPTMRRGPPWLPVGAILGYRRDWLLPDIVAGLVLTALLVPQAMAYAELAGLRPVTGLYTTVLGLTAYALFGPSRILVLGPDSALALSSERPWSPWRVAIPHSR